MSQSTTKIFTHYRSDDTFVFERGQDKVYVTVADDARVTVMRILAWLIFGIASLFLGLIFAPFLILFVLVALGAYGSLSLRKQEAYQRAEMEARKQFDRMEAERWAAMRSFKG